MLKTPEKKKLREREIPQRTVSPLCKMRTQRESGIRPRLESASALTLDFQSPEL
jgi:hypothetical protein